MSFIQVNDVLDWMYRGSDYTLKVTVKEPFSLVPFDLTGTTLYALLTTTDISDVTVLEIAGVIEDAGLGMAKFVFVPANTKDLLARSYNLTIYVEQGTEVFPVIKGLFGIVATPTIPEEEGGGI